jgi:hypothetical protein
MTNTCLIAIDGSEPSLKSIDHIITDATTRAAIPRIYLVNVQPALPSDITRFIDRTTVEAFQRRPAIRRWVQRGSVWTRPTWPTVPTCW